MRPCPSPSMMTSRRILLCASPLLLLLATEAHGAGGAHVVDDAAIEDPGTCNLETWTSAMGKGSALLTASAACTPRRFPWLQAGGWMQRTWTRSGGRHAGGPRDQGGGAATGAWHQYRPLGVGRLEPWPASLGGSGRQHSAHRGTGERRHPQSQRRMGMEPHRRPTQGHRRRPDRLVGIRAPVVDGRRLRSDRRRRRLPGWHPVDARALDRCRSAGRPAIGWHRPSRRDDGRDGALLIITC